MFGFSERRVLRVTTDATTARQVLRSRLVPMREDMPGGYLGKDLRPGVRGWVVGRRMWLGVAPPGRTLWGNRRSPLVFGQVEQRVDGGSDLRFAVFRQGFPVRAWHDPEAEAFLEEWLRDLQSALGRLDPAE